MKFNIKKIVDLPEVYVTAEFNFEGERFFGVASEARDGNAYIINKETLEYKKFWEGDYGVMNLVQVPNQKIVFSINKFYPIFQSKEACINMIVPGDEEFDLWKAKKIADFPFCHRIGIVKGKESYYLLACTLCKDKDFQEDWSKPGEVWVSKIPSDIHGSFEFVKILDGLTKNHGLFIDESVALITSEEGVFSLDFSEYVGGRIDVEKLSDTPTSDICVYDNLLATIEPFHGDTVSLYKNDINKGLLKLLSFEISFGHVIWLGNLFNKVAIIIGNRGGDKTLDLYLNEGNVANENDWKKTILDKNVGATQISVSERNGSVAILSANHGAGEVSLYEITQSNTNIENSK